MWEGASPRLPPPSPEQGHRTARGAGTEQEPCDHWREENQPESSLVFECFETREAWLPDESSRTSPSPRREGHTGTPGGQQAGTLRVVCSHGHRETPCAGQGHHPIRHASTGSTLGSHVPPSPSHHPYYQKPYRVCVGGRQRAPNSSTGGSRLCRWHGSLSCALSSPQTVQRLAGQGRARQGMGACVLGTPAWLSSYTAARPGACPSLPASHPTFRHLPFVAWKLESNMATCVPTWVASPAPPSSATPP